jgi:hypothetical protein
MLRWFRVFTFLMLIPLFGCSMAVKKENPSPNIALDSSEKSLRLVLGENIKSNFEINNDGIKKVVVESWRETLQAGFKAGFSDIFKLNKEAEHILRITKADLNVAPTSVVGGKYGAGVGSVSAQITFKAEVYRGKTKIKTIANTVVSKVDATTPDGVSASAKSAVESMYEFIAENLLKGI